MDNENNKKKRKASLVLPDQVVETVYDPDTQQAQFAVFKDNVVQYSDFITTEQGEFFPLDGKNDLLSKGVVLLPSTASDYGSEAELISVTQAFIHKYLDVSPMYERIASYYVLFSWLHDRFYELPYLRAIGDFGSGKTRFLQTIGSICYRPIFTGGATTTAPIFRILDEIKGTLVLDEADLKFSDMTADIIKILNMGYQKGGSVLRMKHKDSTEIKAFDVFSPKIIATRETFKDKALESRFLVEQMGSSSLRKDIPRRLSDEFYSEAREIRNKLLMWRFRNYNKELDFDEAEIEGIHPRLHQIVIPLLTIIDSDEMKESLKVFVKNYNKELVADMGQSRDADIVLAILRLQHERNIDSLTVKEITDEVNKDIDIGENNLHSKKVGWILRAKLQFKTYRARNGYTLSLSTNKERLDYWKGRLGITSSDIEGEHVNDVNIIESEIDPETIPF